MRVIDALINTIEAWLIHFRPHDKSCPQCQTLLHLLETEKAEKRKLLDFVITTEKPALNEVPKEPKPVMPRTISWQVRKEMLEAEDRKRAEILKEQSQEIEELEKELGVGDAK